MSDANVIHSKNEDGVFAALQALALVVVGGNRVNRNVTDSLMHRIPIFSGGGEALEDHRVAFCHIDVVVRAMLMTGGDNMLIEGWPAQITARMGIGKNAGAFARGNLKCRMPEPFDFNRPGVGGGHSEDGPSDHFHLMAESQDSLR